jgi:hypothetical protein
MQADEFITVVLQAVVFTPAADASPQRFMSSVYGGWASRFDAAPIVLPIPPMMPPEVPRIQLASADGSWRFEASPVRASLTCVLQDGAPSPAAFFDEASARFAEYAEKLGVSIGRVAALITRALPQSEPGIALAQHFCKERWQAAPLNRPEGFEIHAHKRYAPEGLPEVNSWVRIKTGAVQRNEDVQRAIFAEQDINTVVIPDLEFGREALVRFYGRMPPEHDAILKLYFPPELNQ